MLSQRKVIGLLALTLLVGLIVLSGCLLNPKPTSADPIVGIWVWTSSTDNTIYTDTFVSDGTYVATSSDSSISSKTGTWSKIQNNEYLVKRSDGETYTWIYHPATDTITQPEYPNVPSYRQGKQPLTAKPISITPTVARAQDPITGVWSNPGNPEFRIKFGSDGTSQETDSNSAGVLYGTWRAQGGNKYVVTYESGTTHLWTYVSSPKTIYEDDYSNLIYYPYQGSVYFS
jgi:hypothetical protein